MKFNHKNQLWELGNEYMIVSDASQDINLTDVFTLNASSAFLWNTFLGKDFETQDLVNCLCQRYQVDPQIATRDVQKFLGEMSHYGFLIQ